MPTPQSDSDPPEHVAAPQSTNGPEAAIDAPSDAGLRRFALVCLCTASVLVNASFSIPGPVLPTIQTERGILSTWVGVIFGAQAAATFAFSPVVGYILQHAVLQRKSALMLGIVIVSTALGLFGCLHWLESNTLFVAGAISLRAMQGVGTSFADTASSAMVVGLYGASSGSLSFALGMLEASLALGWMLGPFIGGWLAQLTSFSVTFWTSAAAGAVLLPTLALLLPGRVVEQQTEAGPERRLSLGAVLRLPAVLVALSVFFMASSAFTWIDPCLPTYMLGLGYRLGQVGLMFAWLAGVYAAACPLMGAAADKLSGPWVLLVGLLLNAGAYVIMRDVAGVQGLMAALGLLALGGAMTYVPCMGIAMGAADRSFDLEKEPGLEDLLSGLMNSAFHLGGVIGPSLGGGLVDLWDFRGACWVFGWAMAGTAAVVLASWRVLAPPSPPSDGDVAAEDASATEPLLPPETATV